MRKIYTLITMLSIFAASSFAQVTLLSNDFAGYAGTIGTIAPGWYYSYNDSGTTKSYYTSAGNFGAAAPSYKFGRDSVTIITPRIIGAPNTVSFWMKGNGSSTSLFSLQNTFTIYESTDSANWTVGTVIDSLQENGTGSTDSMSVSYPLSATTAFVKFFYTKFVGNIAFDNLVISGLPDGISSAPSYDKAPHIYPNPTRGLVNVDIKSTNHKNITISLFNVLGKEIKTISLKENETTCPVDLSEFKDGVYFIKVKTDGVMNTQRIVLRK